MATYTKTGFGRLDDNHARFNYDKTGAGIVGLPWVTGTPPITPQIYSKSGYGRLDDFGARPAGNVVAAKTGAGRAGGFGAGRKQNNIYVKTGLQTYWWPEPPAMEDWVGVRAKGGGTATKNIKSPPAGGGVAGAVGRGTSAAVWSKRGAGLAGSTARGTRAGTGTRGAAVKTGFGKVGGFGSGRTSLTGFKTTFPIVVGVYDDTAVAGVSLLIGGVPYGPEVTANLDSKVLNGSFETNTAGWTAIGGASIARATSPVRYGSGSLSIVASGNGVGAQSSGGGVWRAGHGYRVGVWLFGSGTARVGVYRPTTGTVVGSKTVALTQAWQRVFLDVAITSDDLYAIQLTASGGGASFFADGVSAIEHVVFDVNSSYYPNGLYDVSARVRDGASHVTQSAIQRVQFRNTAQPLPTLKLEIAFGSSPRDDAQLWVDVTSDFQEGTWGHGRSAVLDRMEAGQLSVTLDNTARKYDNLNQDSPYFGNVVVGKRIRATATYNGWSYHRFSGSITEWAPQWNAGGRSASIRISATDDFTPLSRLKISTPRAHVISGTSGQLSYYSRVGGGNDITVTVVDPGVESDFSIAVTTTTRYARDTGSDDESVPFIPNPSELQISTRNVVVVLEHDGAHVTTTTAALQSAINAHADAGTIVEAQREFWDDGTLFALGMDKVQLTGGERHAETTGQRIGWVLDKLDIPDDRRGLDVGTVNVAQAQLDREQALDHAQLVAATELGQLFFNGDGTALFHDANRRRYSAVRDTYADAPNTSAGVHQYVSGQPSQGTELIYNDIEVAAPDLPAVSVADSRSADAYWPSSYDHQTLLSSADEMEERGLVLLSRYKDPVEQLREIRLEPLREAVGYHDPTAWPHALTLEVSDRLHVYRSPPGGGQLLYESFVESIKDDVRAGREVEWSLTVGMSVAFTSSDAGSTGGVPGTNTWVLEDATFGILDQTTRVG